MLIVLCAVDKGGCRAGVTNFQTIVRLASKEVAGSKGNCCLQTRRAEVEGVLSLRGEPVMGRFGL